MTWRYVMTMVVQCAVLWVTNDKNVYRIFVIGATDLTSYVMFITSHVPYILYLPLQHLSIHLNSEIKMYLFIDLNNESKCSIKTTKSVCFRAYLFPRKICSWSCAMLSADCWVANFSICFDLVDNLKATVHMKKIKRSKKCRSLVLFAP